MVSLSHLSGVSLSGAAAEAHWVTGVWGDCFTLHGISFSPGGPMAVFPVRWERRGDRRARTSDEKLTKEYQLGRHAVVTGERSFDGE